MPAARAGWWHFGLGEPRPRPSVRVLWPDGTDGGWQPVDADNFYVLKRGGTAEKWSPPEGG